jgi:hypothetical protein
MEAWREELYHHGVDGQKWGVRHGPPYPLEGAGKAAAQAAKNSVANSMANKVVQKAAGNDKNKFFTSDDMKTILKGAAMAAATAGLTKVFGNVGDAVISIGKKAVSKGLHDLMTGQSPLSEAASNIGSMIDMLRLDGVL